MEKSNILCKLDHLHAMYLTSDNGLSCKTCSNVDLSKVRLYRILSQSVSDTSENLLGMENILDALQIPDLIYVYVIEGTPTGIHFYCGIAPDIGKERAEEDIQRTVEEGEEVFIANLEANYDKIQIEKLDHYEMQQLQNEMIHKKKMAVIEGVPGCIKSTSSLGMDRFHQKMKGESFLITLLAKPLIGTEIFQIKQALQEGNSVIASAVSMSKVHSNVQSEDSGFNIADTKTNTETTLNLRGEQMQFQLFTANKDVPVSLENELVNEVEDIFFSTKPNDHSQFSKINHAINRTKPQDIVSATQRTPNTIPAKNNDGSVPASITVPTPGTVPVENPYCDNIDQVGNFYDPDRKACMPLAKDVPLAEKILSNKQQGIQPADTLTLMQFSKIDTKSITNSKACANSVAISTNKRKNKSSSCVVTQLIIDSEVQSWKDYLNNVLYNRILFGENRGLYVYSTAIYADSSVTLHKVAATWKGCEEYQSLSKVPMKVFRMDKDKEEHHCFTNFCIPRYYLNMKNGVSRIHNDEVIARSLCSQVILQPFIFGGYCVSSKELRYQTALPITFQPSQKQLSALSVSMETRMNETHFLYGCLVLGSNHFTRRNLIAWTLRESTLPFLLFQKNYGQYGELEGILIRINPFELIEGESILSHIEMVTACLTICYSFNKISLHIIESAIYRCYQELGWNLTTSSYTKTAPKRPKYPSMADVLALAIKLVYRQELSNMDKLLCKAQIEEALTPWILGKKGEILNVTTSTELSFMRNERIVIDLHEFTKDPDKNFYMLLVLVRYITTIRSQGLAHDQCNHVLVYEDIYQLFEKAKEESQSQKSAAVSTIESFINSAPYYGEGFLLAEEKVSKIPYEHLASASSIYTLGYWEEIERQKLREVMHLSAHQTQFLSLLPENECFYYCKETHRVEQLEIPMLSD